MKIACDMCEKVVNKDNAEREGYDTIVVGGIMKYCMCKGCMEKFWKFLDEGKQEITESDER